MHRLRAALLFLLTSRFLPAHASQCRTIPAATVANAQAAGWELEHCNPTFGPETTTGYDTWDGTTATPPCDHQSCDTQGGTTHAVSWDDMSTSGADLGLTTSTQPTGAEAAAQDVHMQNLHDFWNTFRDPDNGLYCDSIYFDSATVCGPGNNFYSIASVGMGLVADCLFAELGFLPRSVAKARALTTIESVLQFWPRAAGSGYFQHFTNRNWEIIAEYSTIDTTIGALGALFAGNYFGGEVMLRAEAFARIPKWTAGIKGTEPPSAPALGTIPSACAGDIDWGFNHGKNFDWYQADFGRPFFLHTGVVLSEGTHEDFQRAYKCMNMNAQNCNDQGLDFPLTCSTPPCNMCFESSMFMSSAEDGQMTEGTLKPFNEYYMLAYLATKGSLARNDTTALNLELSRRYFDVFFGHNSTPEGDGTYPTHVTYNGIDLLSDAAHAVPSFHVQFCYFLTKQFGNSPFYSDLFRRSMMADMMFWELTLDHTSTLQGTPVYGLVWGTGAGIAPEGYYANSFSHNGNLVFSAPIMAGFLKADPSRTADIVNQLQHLYDNNICTYEKELPSGSTAKILWRCSIAQPSWRAGRAESIDWSTMLLGYAQRYLPEGFYQAFAF